MLDTGARRGCADARTEGALLAVLVRARCGVRRARGLRGAPARESAARHEGATHGEDDADWHGGREHCSHPGKSISAQTEAGQIDVRTM